LEARVAEMYSAMGRAVAGLSATQPVRLWNHIPAIHEVVDGRRNRYMVFNAGRYRAFAEWYGGPAAFDRKVATASGVGHDGRDLVVHCLSAREPGVAVDNPRQIAPHRYSERWGPLPPCFARGTLLNAPRLILVGGTASVRGEDSLHVGNLPMQVRETFMNLATVVEAANGPDASRGDEDDLLAQFRELRVYYPHAADGPRLEAMVRQTFARECRIEMRRADLCRAELLVEIEGVAGGGVS
jgi:chorismate lyase/3-hydroxybenzoate synthase